MESGASTTGCRRIDRGGPPRWILFFGFLVEEPALPQFVPCRPLYIQWPALWVGGRRLDRSGERSRLHCGGAGSIYFGDQWSASHPPPGDSIGSVVRGAGSILVAGPPPPLRVRSPASSLTRFIGWLDGDCRPAAARQPANRLVLFRQLHWRRSWLEC